MRKYRKSGARKHERYLATRIEKKRRAQSAMKKKSAKVGERK